MTTCPEAIVQGSSGPGEETAVFRRSVIDAKRRLILGAIDRAGGNYTAAARLLGINPTYLHRLLRNLQLKGLVARR